MKYLLDAIELEIRYQKWLAYVPKYAGQTYGRASYIMYLAKIGLDTVRQR